MLKRIKGWSLKTQIPNIVFSYRNVSKLLPHSYGNKRCGNFSLFGKVRNNLAVKGRPLTETLYPRANLKLIWSC